MVVAAFVLVASVAFAAGLRVKHRRFLAERAERVALARRMDSYRLADTRTDLDVVGPVTGPTPVLYDQDVSASAPRSVPGPWAPAAKGEWR